MAAKVASRLEPFGHEHALSKIERIWAERIAGHALLRRRVPTFDTYSGVSFAPMEYWYEKINYDNVAILDEGWVREQFLAFVKGEFTDAQQRPPIPHFAKVVREAPADPDTIENYVLTCERRLLYRFSRTALKHTEADLLDNVLAVLCDRELGHRKNEKNIDKSKLRESLSKMAQAEARLMFVLPSFPFKDQNLLRTYKAAASEFDLGEIALLIRLHLLSLALYQVHAWGTDWVVAADGKFYAKMFGIPEAEATAYFDRLRRVRSQLNISGTVSLIDLQEVVEHYAAGCPDKFQADREFIRASVAKLAASDDDRIKHSFGVLKRGMRQNQSTRAFEADLLPEELWQVCMWDAPMDTSGKVGVLHRENDARAHEIAIDYATENLVLRLHDVLNRVFPGNVRTTVHPKPGQIAVPQIGNCFPWNGVAFVQNPSNIDVSTVDVRRFYELGRKSEELCLFRHWETGAPLYFCPA